MLSDQIEILKFICRQGQLLHPPPTRANHPAAHYIAITGPGLCRASLMSTIARSFGDGYKLKKSKPIID